MKESIFSKSVDVRFWISSEIKAGRVPNDDAVWAHITTTWPNIPTDDAEKILNEAMKPAIVSTNDRGAVLTEVRLQAQRLGINLPSDDEELFQALKRVMGEHGAEIAADRASRKSGKSA